MSFNYTKEMVLQEFKDATAKDEKKSKKTYANRVEYLKGLKKFKQETPQYMRDVKISVKQFDNLISAWSAPNPRDAFYLKVFGKTYADQKAHERKMYGSDKEEETLN